jgi:uncharacterized protein (DUF169 family)
LKPATLDYDVLEALRLVRKPVGVKFLPYVPEGIPRIRENLNFCQMFVHAQAGEPFYVLEADLHCVEPLILGMKESEAAPMSGLVGEMDDLFEELRANQKIYYLIPRMLRHTVKSVVFASIAQMSFDPDVLVITTDNTDQARTIMRAYVYSTGETWSSEGMPVLACSWLYVYPYLTGKLNYTITGLSLGMQTLQVLPQGLMVISIPWQKLPMVLTNLKNMNWLLESEIVTGDEHKRRFGALLKDIEARINR